jgi:hypothetical protein
MIFDILKDALLDTLKLLPFLFIAFLIIELVEHKLKNKETLKKAGKFGPIVGSLLGGIPQCGFATVATNLYVTRIISLGTLISIYLATSDEMLPIMISENVELPFILKIVALKVLIGMVVGVIIDLIYQKTNKETFDLCEKEHCHCHDKKHSLIKSSIKHTLNIALFILIVNIVLNTVFELSSETVEFLKAVLGNSNFGPFVASLLGLIPNCGSSVLITELYLNEVLSLGSLLAGLLTNSGIALVILFKTNKNLKENLTILGLVYLIGSIIGLIVNLF